MNVGEPRHPRRTLLPLLSATATELPATSEDAAYLAAFARFLHRNVASGDAAADTRATYGVHVATWLAWCSGAELGLASATIDDVEDYREALIGAGCQRRTPPACLQCFEDHKVGCDVSRASLCSRRCKGDIIFC